MLFLRRNNMSRKIRLLIVDDSSVIRTLFTKIFSLDPEIEVVGTAPDPYIAREKLVQLKPDVMTLDLEMPRMDGLTFLEKVMEHFPTRTVIISSLSTEGSETALRALELGAVDVMAKPTIDLKAGLESIAAEMTARVKEVAKAQLPVRSSQPIHSPGKKLIKPQAMGLHLKKTTHQILAIASSTGGTEALKKVLPLLPSDLPGTVVVQHMPPVFTKTYADALAQLCPFEVKEAVEGDRVQPGRVLIAPGNFHMELMRNGAYYHVKLNQGPLLHGVRPAADHLFRSVAKYAGGNAVGLVLTGMGNDGAAGLLEMKKAGSFNIAQDEKSCVVYGMPKKAVEAGAIDKSVKLEDIAQEIVKIWTLREAA
jgi:two-component system chemotaxis response regulator CheB